MGGLAIAIGTGIASSLIAKLIEKTSGKLWGLRQSDLEKKIAAASEVAFGDFVAAFPKGKALSDTKILKRFFDSITLKEELGKIFLTDNEFPNLNTLHEAFMNAGYTDDMLPGFDFNGAMTAFITKFKEELADVQRRRMAEKAQMRLYLQQVAEHCGRLDFVGIPDLRDKQDLRLDDIFITLRARGQVPEADVLPDEEVEAEDAEEMDLRRRAREDARTREAAPVKLDDVLNDNMFSICVRYSSNSNEC